MATTTDTSAEHDAGHDAGHGAGHHPTPRDYVRIAIVLAAITAAEIAASYIALPEALFFWGLAAMATAKFVLVVAWYMHLKFDDLMFRRLFVTGIVLAISVFLLVLGLFAMKTTASEETGEDASGTSLSVVG